MALFCIHFFTLLGFLAFFLPPPRSHRPVCQGLELQGPISKRLSSGVCGLRPAALAAPAQPFLCSCALALQSCLIACAVSISGHVFEMACRCGLLLLRVVIWERRSARTTSKGCGTTWRCDELGETKLEKSTRTKKKEKEQNRGKKSKSPDSQELGTR